MNKFEEAFHTISNFIRDILRQGEGMETLSFRTLEAVVTLKQLVDRATPKKVEYLNDECCCSVCGCKLFAARPVDFCPSCGQALDWRDEDEK